jgi:hypothetical protein
VTACHTIIRADEFVVMASDSNIGFRNLTCAVQSKFSSTST